jgi:hypothetical protein
MADNDYSAIEDLVRRDIEAGLAGGKERLAAAPFTPVPRLGSGDDGVLYANAITGGQFTAVEWAFSGQHVAEFAGIPASNREVTIYGVTIVRQRGDTMTFRRYVDWSAVMVELGVSASFRPAYERIAEIPNIRTPDAARANKTNKTRTSRRARTRSTD